MTSKGTLQNARDSVAAGEASAHAPARDAARALPLFESLKALIEEAGELACNAALDSGARFKRLCALDAYARAILDSALESSGRALGLSGYQRDPAVFLARDLYGSLLDGYHRCDSGRANDEADQRRKLQLMKAAAERTKWERFAGGPSYAGLWQWTGAVMQTTPELPPLSGAGPETGGEPAAEAMVRQEYLRTLAYFSASYEQLSPDLFGVVSRIVDLSLPWLQLDRLPAPGTLYYVDLEGGVGPVRFVHHPQPSHGVRFFSTARAHEQLTELRRALSKGQLPAGFDLMPVKRGALAAGIDHLLVHWSATPPVRRNRRHPVSGALDAVVGFDLVELVLTGQTAPGIRRWCFTDVSRGGVACARIPGSRRRSCQEAWLRSARVMAASGIWEWRSGYGGRTARACRSAYRPFQPHHMLRSLTTA